METGIGAVIKSGNGNAIIMTAVIAAAISNMLPTPMDAVYFSRQAKLKEDLEAGKISPSNYWWHDVGEYYLWTSLWYAGLFTVLQAYNGEFKNNARILLALASAGIIVGVVNKNIHRDEEMRDLAKQQQDALSGKTPAAIGS